jgi:uncharacterized protein (DUF952 family)
VTEATTDASRGWATARITHLVERDEWERTRQAGVYAPASLELEGFVHCSTPWQVVRTANRLFPVRDDLLFLVIDPSKLDAQVVFENCERGIEPFPHVYGAIDVVAVEHEFELAWDAAEQSYRLPDRFGAS